MATSPQQYNPIRSPLWRWQRALELTAAGKRPGKFDDEWVRRALPLARQLRSDPDAAARDTDDPVAAAYALFGSESPRRDEIEARLLAAQGPQAIAEYVGVAAAVIEAFEAVFYNVVDRLRAHDWVLACVLRVPDWPATGPRRGDCWRWVAHSAGLRALDILVGVDLGRREPAIPRREVFARQVRLLVLVQWATLVGDEAAVASALQQAREAMSGRTDPLTDVAIVVATGLEAEPAPPAATSPCPPQGLPTKPTAPVAAEEVLHAR